MSWETELLRQAERDRDQRQGLEGAFGMTVNSASGESEFMRVSFFGNRDRPLNIPHPFISSGSWIRAIPEVGTTYTALYRLDQSSPQAVNTYLRQAGDRVQSYRERQGIFRALSPGEIEVSSIGQAQTFFGRRSYFENNASLLKRAGDLDTLTLFDRAPIHSAQLLQYQHEAIDDVYKLGIVQRPKNAFEVFYPKVRGDFAAEEYLDIKNPAGQNPASLYRMQRGHVIDIDGVQVTQTVTSIPLRFLETYYANDDSSTQTEIDEKGNYFRRLAQAATEGYELQIPSGNYRKTVELDEIITVNGNQELAVGHSGVHTYGDNFSHDTGKISTFTVGPSGQNYFMQFNSDVGQFVLSTPANHFFIIDDSENTMTLLHASGAAIQVDANGRVIAQDAEGDALNLGDGVATIRSSSGSVVEASADGCSMSAAGGLAARTSTTDGSTTEIAKNGYSIEGDSFNAKVGSVFLGDNPSFNSVLSQNLVAYLSTMTVICSLPGNSSSPPTVPPAALSGTPLDLSALFVFQRGNF